MMQPRAEEQEPAFAAFVAIDWADREHAWSMEVPGQKQRSRGKLEHTPEAIAGWAMELATRLEGRPIAVALEQARGALLYALSAYGHFVLYPIHPTTSSRYRAAMFPSGSKDDPKDADLLLDLLVHHRDRLRPLRPDTPAIRELQALVEKRRQLVDEKTAQTNRITDQLKLYYPQILHWFEGVDSPLVAAFLQRWPRLEQVQAEDPEPLRAFFRQHHSRSKQRIEERIQAMQQAQPIHRDPGVIGPAAMLVQIFLQVVAVLREGIATVEKAIEELASAHPDFYIFASFPGAGPALAPRLLAAFGSLRERFDSAQQVQSYSGIAPVISRSGETQFWVHFRWACPKFLRQSFHEFAALSIPHCEWAQAFYHRQRDRGKGHHAAVRSLAFKWIRILFRCWQSRVPYQEELYLRARQERTATETRPPSAGSPPSRIDTSCPPPVAAAPSLPPCTTFVACGGTVEIQLKQVAGFWKISSARA